jgi:hypothetical protein
MPKLNLNESAVIYHSDEDECWIAHGLHTDQIGTGDRLVTALADLMKAVHSVCELAATDETISYLRPAPPEIQKMFAQARVLPKELSEISHKMAFGEWPEYLRADFTPEDVDGSFRAEMSEAGCA